MSMKTLQDITEAIERLSADERVSLERWFYTHAFENQEEDEEEDEDLGNQVAEPSAAYKLSHEHRRLSVEEYLASEAARPIRHEYIDGEIFAMAGVSRKHHRISGNLFNAFSNRLRGGPCEVFMSDFKVRLQIHRKEIFYYPDVMVACGREGMKEYYLTHPKLIVEVLSPSTKKTDLREKALNYRQIPSLEEYVLVAQDRYEVTIQRRSAEWEPTILASTESIVEFHPLELSLPLPEIYAGAL